MLIVNGHLVTSGQRGPLIKPGALRIVGDRIAELGTSADLRARFLDEEVLDAEGMLVVPGFISAHTHLHDLALRGWEAAETVVGHTLSHLRHRLDVALDYEAIRYTTLAACVEAIQNGVTLFFAQHSSPSAIEYALDAVAEATLQAGVRACLGYAVSDRHSTTQGRRGVEENARFARRVRQEPLLAATMGLDECAYLSDDTLAAAVGTAAITDIGFHAHAARELDDVRECLTRYGQRGVERLRRRGVLGRRTVVVGGIHLTPEEMEWLARAGAWLVHTPRADEYDSVGIANVTVLAEHGVPVCLGDDGYVLNLLGEMQAAYLAHRADRGHPRAHLADEIWRMACIHNAALAERVFHERVGALAAGALADIVLIDYTAPTPLTAANLAQHLVNGVTNRHVDTTIVAGRVLMRHRTLLTLDAETILARAREAVSRLWEHLAANP